MFTVIPCFEGALFVYRRIIKLKTIQNTMQPSHTRRTCNPRDFFSCLSRCLCQSFEANWNWFPSAYQYFMCWLNITKVSSYQSTLCVIGHNTSIMLWVLPEKTISTSYVRLIQILYQKLNNYNWISKLKLIFLHFEDKWLFRLSPFRFLKASNLLRNQKCYKSWNNTNTSREYSICMRWEGVNYRWLIELAILD